MHRSIPALIAVALLLSSILSFAADKKPEGSGAAADGATKTEKIATKAPAAKSKAKVAAKLVDINSASKAALTKLPGVSDAEADKIIAGRPYLTKARLVTNAVVSPEVYEKIKKLIIAKQK